MSKVHQLNITKITKKGYKKKSHEKYRNLSKEEKEKEATTWT